MVDILGIGTSGLTAYRKLLETVGGNITNANTEGYLRRDVVLSGAGDSAMLPTASASASGSGVTVDTVRRANDAFLQIQSLKANSLNLQSQTLADSLTQIEKTLFATTSNPGSIVQDFYSRFNDVANAPTSAAARISVLDSGKQVASVFTEAAGAINDSLTAVRSGLEAALTSVNSITKQLGLLNVQIQSAATSGQKPNDLLDQRDKLLSSLSNLANFSFSEQPTGAVTVYLGDTASGRPLVFADGSHPLGVSETSDKLEIVMDPNSAPAPTNQLTSGMVAGLLDFRQQVKLLRDDINRLAVGFSVAVNEQHKQGVDLNGQQGGNLFSADGLDATAAKNNLGDAKLLLSIDNAANIDSATYTARFNQSGNVWTVKSSDGKSMTAENNLSLGGVSFTFDGRAKDGDTFTVSPLLGAAASMRFLVQTPAEVAVALPLYVDPSPENTGQADVRPLKRTDTDPLAPIPSATTVFDSAHPINDFLKDGAAFMLPAGATSISLSSLGVLSAVHFNATGSQIRALTAPDAGDVSKLKLSIFVGNTNTSLAKYDLDLALQGSSLNDVANAINVSAEREVARGNNDLKDSFFASVTNGVLTINALNGKEVNNGALIGAGLNSNGDPRQIIGVNENLNSAASVRIFTRDGRQVSGPELSPSEGLAFVTTANGFLPDAQYNKDYLSTGYPRLNVSEAPSLLAPTSTSFTGAKIDISTQSSFDIPQAGYGQTPLSGAVYALKVDGLQPVRVAGDSLAGAGPADITAQLANQLNAQASRVSWLGAPIKFSDTMPARVAFEVSIDGQQPPRTVTFQRSQETRNLKLSVTGFKIGTQEIVIDKSAGSSKGVDWAYVDGKLQISSKVDSTISINPTVDYQALGFNGSESGASVTATRQSSLLRETGTFDIGGATDIQVSLVNYEPNRVEVALNANSAGGKTVQLTNADGTQVFAEKILTDADVAAGVVTFDKPTYGSYDGSQLSSFQIVNGQREALLPPTDVSPSSTYDVTRVQVALNTNSAKGQTVQLTNATGTQVLATKILTDSDIATRQVTFDRPLMGSVDVAKLSAYQIVNGTRETLDQPSALTTPTKIDLGGATRLMITIPQKLRSTAPQISITPVSLLSTSMLATSKPSLYVNVAGNPVRLTIDSQKGESNGIKWEVVDGRLSLNSITPISIDMSSLQKKSLANSLGFSEQKPAQNSIVGDQVGGIGLAAMGLTDGKPATTNVTSPNDITASLLSSLKPKLYLIKPSKPGEVFELNIDAPSGAKNNISWSIIDGKLALSSDDMNMSFDPNHSNSFAEALGFDPAQNGNKFTAVTMAAKALLETLPPSSQPEISVVTGSGATQALYTFKINSTSGYDPTSGVSWKLLSGKLSFVTGDSALQIVGTPEQARTSANMIGFNGTDLDLNIESTITSANKLTPSLLSVLKPTLQVKGDQLGTQLLTIDRPNGTYNSVTWSLLDGKLTLTSSDRTLRVDAGTTASKLMADRLGFTDVQPNYPVTAKDSVYESMLKSGGGLQLTISTDEKGDIPVTISKAPDTDTDSGVSWSYNAQTDRLTFSSIYSSFNVTVGSSGAPNAQALGFMGAGLDKKIEAARLSLSSIASDRVVDLVDTSATVSHVGQSVAIDGGVPEDLVVFVKNPDGFRRIAGTIDMAAVPPPPLRPDLQIRILAGGKLEISDPASGASLATRSWQQDVPVSYLGMSFTIHGAAKEGDLYTIRNDSTRTSDNRNALRIAELATTSIFGKGQGSFQDVYAGVTSRLGSTVQATNTRAGATAQAAADLKAAYEGKTGVNLDKEAADLIRYQQAYQAAAQIIMAAREMFATILKSF